MERKAKQILDGVESACTVKVTFTYERPDDQIWLTFYLQEELTWSADGLALLYEATRRSYPISGRTWTAFDRRAAARIPKQRRRRRLPLCARRRGCPGYSVIRCCSQLTVAACPAGRNGRI